MSSLVNMDRWRVLEASEEAERTLMQTCGISQLCARVMAARGITNPDAAKAFLNPDLLSCWKDPMDLPGMKDAVERVKAAIDQNERIAIFGDFDVDGMSSTCLLTLALRHLGADVYPYIPHRFDEGYGLSLDALERVISDCHPDLIITVDNGISAAHEVEWLQEIGIDVVITDHHEPADLVPQDVPVTDPKLCEDCESQYLAGAGVALKMVCALGRLFNQPDLWLDYTQIATLGTVSDMMLLVDENRALVAHGIEQMQKTQHPGLIALAHAAHVDLSTISANSLPFTLIPRLNAAGRMGCTEVAFNLLLASDMDEATELACQLEKINNERREIESQLTQEAMAQVEATYNGQRVIVVGGEGWHEGVKGIVASRIVNRYRVPVILFTISDGVARGSGRSVGRVDLFQAVNSCQDLLVRFGGHAGAVGVTIDAANIDAFRERMEEVLDELPAKDFLSQGEVASIVSLSDLSLDSIKSLDCLEPFGQGNKRPLLAATGVLMRDRACVGATADHLRFIATDGINPISAIMFRAPQIRRAVECDEVVDLVFDAVAEEWMGRVKPKLMIQDILYHSQKSAQEVQVVPLAQRGQDFNPLVEKLFGRAGEILSSDEYANVAEAQSFYTKVVGTNYQDSKDSLSALQASDRLYLNREPDNPADPNAIAVVDKTGQRLGYLRRQVALGLAPVIDKGTRYEACVVAGHNSSTQPSHGVNICVMRMGAVSAKGTKFALTQARRSELSSLSYDELTEELRKHFIGDNTLLKAQDLALEKLSEHKSCLCVMATGRGKSLIFHLHAAREAIAHNKMSVFVFPLRALVNDQAFHLQESLAKIGVDARVLSGETTLDMRQRIFSDMAQHKVDIILTTPEFLAIHTSRFEAAQNIDFVVIDEAHHAGMTSAGNRPSYTQMPRILEQLGNPVALAVTATAQAAVAGTIQELLSIDEANVIIDDTCRQNLVVVDNRNLRHRDAALISVVAKGEKCVVYVNSREQTISLARMLRKAIPDQAHRIAFYNAGLTRTERKQVEAAFRGTGLSCIVSTSAFGEGVNLPGIRHVFLYHMPFGATEFNQMAGRAGRDGDKAWIHMMFGPQDARLNERILQCMAPNRKELVSLYRCLMSASKKAGGESFIMSNIDIAEAANTKDSQMHLDETSISSGISVFRELGFLETSGYGSKRRIKMILKPSRMQLEDSIRYLEGLEAQDEFDIFRKWALGAKSDELLARINRPITPDTGVRVG